MASIGENAYGKNLTVDKLTYTTLDPPIGGFVNNPLTGVLQCNNQDIGAGPLPNAQAADNIYCNTLNYTTLNPPINPGVTNPLAVDLLCAGKNIGVGAPADKANEIKGVTGTFDNSALGVATGTTLTTTGAVTAVGSTYGALGNIVDSLTVGNGVTVSTGNIVASVGDVIATGNLSATVGSCTAAELIAGNGIKCQTGDIVAEVGRLSVGTTGNPTGATGNIINYGTGSIIAEQGHVRANTYLKADTGNIEATLGNIDSKVGFIQGQELKINNFVDGGTTQSSPIQPTGAFVPDMTGKTKGCFWIYDPASAVIQFFVETGILNVTENASTFLTMNQYSTSNPKRIINYRIGQKDIGGNPDSSILVVSVQMDGVVPLANPVRICLMVIPD